MAREYSIEVVRRLTDLFRRQDLLRPLRVERYDAGDVLTYDVTGVAPARQATVRVAIDKFVGGGFAGQVYRVRVEHIDAPNGPVVGLEVGGTYAMKILRPPSRFAQSFRDAVYAVGFQAPFSLQVNPDAARAGALWQKFIRAAAAERFDDPRSVVDIHATFVDETLGSCGELSEWVDGRTWRFEVDDHLQERSTPLEELEVVHSPEYRAKKRFMQEFVRLLHDVGAHEFARQYEWWTCKSQPNALKRRDTEDDPASGLTAVDFRAGLALLPFLPMSPGDIPLIVKGLLRGSPVQFDRGDLGKLRDYVKARAETFAGMDDALLELTEAETAYRSSMPDVTHNHLKLLYSRELWSNCLDSMVESWEVRGKADEATGAVLRRNVPLAAMFGLMGITASLSRLAGLGLLAVRWLGWLGSPDGTSAWSYLTPGVWIAAAVLIVPLPPLLRFFRTAWGRADYREHYGCLLTDLRYFRRALRARVAESAIAWHRAGRLSAESAERMGAEAWLFYAHLPLSLLPVGLHRILTDRAYAREVLRNLFVRPIKLYFNADEREAWLRQMVADGLDKNMLTPADAEEILAQIDEPFIQKYLKALAVHVCTLPVTQVVAAIVAAIYIWMHPEMSWAEALAAAAAIMALFQVVPISPGSFCRGAYVVYLAARERSVRNYNIAIFLGFFKYIGYLAFPIQMAYRFPTLARFMAGHWATDFVHVVPVFGEHGALGEHAAFDLFYNYPLTVRRRVHLRAEVRRGTPARSWHLLPVALLTAGTMVALQRAWGLLPGGEPSTGWLLRGLWLPGLVGGMFAAWWARGASTGRRVAMGSLSGLLSAAVYTAAGTTLMSQGLLGYEAAPLGELIGGSLSTLAWSMFLLAVTGTVGAAWTETTEPSIDPRRKRELEQAAPDASGDHPDAEAKDALAEQVGVDPGGEVVGEDAPSR